METLDLNKINEALGNEELRGQILETIAKNEHGKTYLDNYAKLHFDNNIGTKLGEVHGAYDRDFETVLGVKKPQGEKSYTFWANQLKELKEKANSQNPEVLSKIQKENEELRKKIENNEEAKYFKDLLETNKKTYIEQIQEKEKLINDFQDRQRRFTIEGDLNKVLSTVKLNEAIPENVRKTFIDTIYQGLLKEAKILEDGSIAYYENGELITNKKTMSRATSEEILSEKLKSIISDASGKKGGGGQQGGFNNPKPSNIPLTGAKTKLELGELIDESLIKSGLTRNSTEYIKQFDNLIVEYGKNLPLR